MGWDLKEGVFIRLVTVILVPQVRIKKLFS